MASRGSAFGRVQGRHAQACSARRPWPSSLSHGGRLQAARLAWPSAPSPFLDLSTGINPHGYPFAPVAASAFARLPEPEDELALRAVAADRYGVPDAGWVAAAPGSQILISLLPRLLSCRRAVILSPTYNEHAAAWSNEGIAVEAVSEIGALEDAADPRTVLVLCNPNNPDGSRLSRDRLAALAGRCATRGGALVVDEAFADLEPDVAGAAPLLPSAGLVVLRSFGKTFGLAGLRLGFLLAEPILTARTRQLLGPWAVAGPAIAIGRQALADRGWIAGMTATLGRAAHRLDRLLEQAGLLVLGGTRLFRLAAAPGTAVALFDRLGAHGILVRRFSEAPDRLRFGIPADEAAWSRLAAALMPPFPGG